MSISIDARNNEAGNCWELKLVGEVDISNAHYFKKQMETALAEKRQSIRLDLTDLNYIDSTGLGVIIGTYGAIKDEGLTIKVANPRDNVKKLLVVSGLDKVLC